jgi:hypothetical protein
VKKDCQVIISPLIQAMLGFRQAIFPAGEYVSDWVVDVKKGLNSFCNRGQYCIGSNTRVIISPSLPSTGTILNNGTWTHRYDTKAYHDYYIHQAGKGYPVFAGRRYQRGHGLVSIFGGLFKAALSLLKKGAPAWCM